MTKQQFINPFTGKFDHHGFKMAQRAKRQKHQDIKKEKKLNDGKMVEITAQIQSNLFDILSEAPVKTKVTVLHTQAKLLPSLAMEQRCLRVYSCQLAEINTNLVVVDNAMRVFKHEITVIS